ncbi:ATP-binding protein [Thermodesulfobacteriota bacterium]
MDKDLEKMLRYLRLGALFENWDDYLNRARKGNYSHVRLLKMVIEEEYKQKIQNACILRLKRSTIPEQFVMETFPFARQPKLNRKKLLSLYDSFDYITKRQNLIFIGPTGAGKSGLATAFLIQALNRGYSGKFIAFPDLIELLYKSVADHSEAKIIKKFASYDCLVIDELGYVEVEPVQVGLFFTLMHKRHRKKTSLITSNLGFQQWTSFLKNEHLTAALIDRLTENSHVINMRKCVSLRPKLDPT